MTIEAFLQMLHSVRRSGDDWKALCPAHDDSAPSLGVRESNGRIFPRCFAGCSEQAILRAMGMTSRDLFVSDRLPLACTKGKGSGRGYFGTNRIEAVYPYRDANGTLIYENVRYRPKNFRQRRPDGNGGYIYNLKGIHRVPYRLPELLSMLRGDDADIWFTEGEKDADNLRSLGFTATSFKNWIPAFNAYIEGTHAVIFRDHDKSGLKQASDAAKIIAEAAKSLKLIDLYDGFPEQGQDISYWIEGHRAKGLGRDEIAEELAILVERSDTWKGNPDQPDASPHPNVNGLQIEFLSTVSTKEICWLARPLIPFGFFTLLDGIEGIGKTYAMLDIAKRLTRAEPMPFCSEVHEPANVLFLSLEDSPEYVLKPRFERMGGDCSRLAVLRGTFDLTEAGFIDLKRTIEAHGIKFVLIDPLFSFTGRADINNTADVRAITDRLNRTAGEYGIAIVGVRHINKSKGLGSARNAGAHSIAWLQGCRSGLIVGHDSENKENRGIGQHKLNIAAESNAVFGFVIDSDGVFRWTGRSDLTIERMLAPKSNDSNEDRSAIAEAIRFIKECLARGGRPSSEVDAEARAAGISTASLRRAKTKLGIKPRKNGLKGGWMWELPEGEQTATAARSG